jgi:PmbA protein
MSELPAATELEPLLAQALEQARLGGATQAEASLSVSRGLSVSVRQDEVESLEFQHDRELGVTVYIGQRKGNASTGDLSSAGIAGAVEAALTIARATGEDACHGLADAALMAREFPELDLDHPWPLAVDAAVDLARTVEAAAFAVDPRVRLSEGAAVNSHRSLSLYANSHGFMGRRLATSHGLSCAVVAQQDQDMQRDYWYSSGRAAADLEDPAAVGRRAGERALARLGAQRIATRQAPVLFVPQLARGLWGHFLAAISGGALYRRSSFLLDQLGQPVFSPRVNLRQRPHLPRGAGSSAFDAEGVATRERALVTDGVLQGWLLGSYSARRLGLPTTGNAGGAYNLVVEGADRSFDELVRDMGEGLIVTELMGQGVNGVTGDYSRGAAGFWVRGGEIAHPVSGVSIAGNLREMYRQIEGLGTDVEPYAGTRTGSVLVGRMTIAAGDA